jgi:hypothetical protein
VVVTGFCGICDKCGSTSTLSEGLREAGSGEGGILLI